MIILNSGIPLYAYLDESDIDVSGEALRFSESPSYIDFGSEPWNMNGKSFAAYCRVKFDATDGFTLWSNRDSDGFTFGVANGASNFGATVVGTTSTTSELSGVSNSFLNTTDWFELLLVFNTGTGKLELWSNGVSQGSDTDSGTIGVDLTPSAADTYFGANPNSPASTNSLDGDVVDIRFYTSDADFSSDDVAGIYSNITPYHATLNAWCPLQEKSGTTHYNLGDSANGSSTSTTWTTQDGYNYNDLYGYTLTSGVKVPAETFDLDAAGASLGNVGPRLGYLTFDTGLVFISGSRVLDTGDTTVDVTDTEVDISDTEGEQNNLNEEYVRQIKYMDVYNPHPSELTYCLKKRGKVIRKVKVDSMFTSSRTVLGTKQVTNQHGQPATTNLDTA